MEIRALKLVSSWVQRLVLSVRSFSCIPNLNEHELSKTKDKPKRISGFVQAHDLAIREQCEMLGSGATQKSESPFPLCNS
jgi:hypothetical protein